MARVTGHSSSAGDPLRTGTTRYLRPSPALGLQFDLEERRGRTAKQRNPLWHKGFQHARRDSNPQPSDP